MRSTALRKSIQFNIITPQMPPTNPPADNKFPVLYLLHGWADDYSAWLRRTSLERYVENSNLFVVMPDAGPSFYQDMDCGFHYWTFLTSELPAFCQSLFPISTRREDTFAAGLSMGGYGAMRLGLTFPERFAAIGSFSGALNISRLIEKQLLEEHPRLPRMRAIFGQSFEHLTSQTDLFKLLPLALQSHSPEELPKFYMDCGTEDGLLQDNIDFSQLAQSLDLSLPLQTPPGAHSWAFWDKSIRNFLQFIHFPPNLT